MINHSAIQKDERQENISGRMLPMLQVVSLKILFLTKVHSTRILSIFRIANKNLKYQPNEVVYGTLAEKEFF